MHDLLCHRHVGALNWYVVIEIHVHTFHTLHLELIYCQIWNICTVRVTWPLQNRRKHEGAEYWLFSARFSRIYNKKKFELSSQALAGELEFIGFGSEVSDTKFSSSDFTTGTRFVLAIRLRMRKQSYGCCMALLHASCDERVGRCVRTCWRQVWHYIKRRVLHGLEAGVEWTHPLPLL